MPSPLHRRFLRVAFPIALSNLTVPLAGLVDTGMLGHLDEIRHLAGVALASVLFDYLYWTFGFLRMGTTGLCAQATGRRDPEEALRVLARALVIAAGLGAALLLLRGPLETLGFALLGGSSGVEASGRAYFRARILGAPAALANFAFIGWFLGCERPGHALRMTLVGNGANIALDYLLIVRLGLASTGAGLATAASQGLMLATALALFAAERPPLRALGAGLFERPAFAALARLNRDILIRTLCLITAFAVFVNVSAGFGSVVLAANAILLKILDTAAYGIDGLAFATESLAGIHLGAGDRGALRELLRLAMRWGLGVALAVIAVVALLGDPLYALLTSHADVARAAREHAPWFALALLFGAAAYVYDGFFIGLTAGPILRNAMLASLAVFLPGALWARHSGSSDVLWAAFGLFMAARVVTLGRHRKAVLSGS